MAKGKSKGGKVVHRYVSVYNEETGESETLAPGMKVPDYAKDQVTNPKVFEKPDGSENEAPVNNEVLAGVTSEQQPKGAQVEEADDDEVTEDEDAVNETPNANPAQRQTAGEPGGNQAPDDGGLAPADDPANPASSVGGGTTGGDDAATRAADADKAATAKKTADANRAGTGQAGSTRTRKATAKKSTSTRSAAKKSTNS